MTKRIFRSILGVSLAVLLASLVLIVGVLHGYFQDRVSGELESLAEYIAHGVEENGTDYLTEDLPGSYRITWVDADGTVLFDNRQDPEEMGNHAQREEIREALILGKGHAVRYSDTLSQQTLYAAQRLADGTVLRVSSAQYSVWVLVLQALQPVALMMLLAFILAMMLIQNVKFQGGFRTIYYLPSVVPFVAAGLMWKILFSRDRGMLNAVLGMFGIEPVFWLGPEMCSASLIIMCLWGAGGGILINIAGLKNIPNELYESASIDGARFFTKLFRITIPLFTPILLFNLLLAIIGNLQMYAQPVMLATSGTGLLAVPFKDNYLYLVHIYQQVFGSQRFGYGLALSWVIVVIILVFTLLVLKSSKRWVNYDL